MTLFRIRLEVDIDAHDFQDAARRARVLHSVLEQRHWVVAVLSDGIEERGVAPPDAAG